MIFYLDLTAYEQEELKQLSHKLFSGNSFVVFSDEEENSYDYKRYSDLLERKLKYNKQIQEGV